MVFHSHLHHWYNQNGRKALPWRNTQDAYAVLVSEIMLQQTQVKTVLERYYHPFLKTFPSLEKLASAPIETVLKSWQGLGYYNRAINLHNAAKQTSPTLPKNIEQLLALPGIGKNTAHAVAAFAYHQPVPVMEANVKRILHRVFALTTATDKQLWHYAEVLLDKTDPFTYNQAMMDVGALVCTKTQPKCPQCPLTSLCKGKGNPDHYPAKKVKKATPTRQKNIVIYTYQDKNRVPYYYISARTTRFLNGLFGFQEYSRNQPTVFYNHQYSLSKAQHLGDIQQSYSHFTLDAELYLITLADGLGTPSIYWKTLEEIRALPLSKADEKALDIIQRAFLA